MANRKRIEGYALVGDTRTAALVDERGSVDWMCLPHFDGEPVFARLLAGDDGGRFTVAPPADARLVARRYRPGTVLVETAWETDDGMLLATDGMVSDVAGSLFPVSCLVRRVEAVRGSVPVSITFDPRVGASRSPLRARGTQPLVACAPGGTALAVATDPSVELRAGTPVEVEVTPGRPLLVVLAAAHREPLAFVSPRAAWERLLDDAARWRWWASGIDYDGPAPDIVERSLLTLRLLTYSPSGAPVAAPTTSVPEWPGGERTWDYRYAWPRDASIGIGAFLAVGRVEQARAFLSWLLHAGRLDRPRLPPVLTIHGRHVPPERKVPDWPGCLDGRPVRFGNAARDQHQLDTYGWVLDAMWLLVRDGHGIDGETWRAGMAFAEEAARRWREPDAGIWEVRDEPAHHVHSKLMAWLALDRAVRIAERRGARPARVARWRHERDAVAASVLSSGFDERRGTFVGAYGGDDLDAATLVLPLVGLEPPGSPRVRGTIAAVRRELGAGGPLLYRYRPGSDGLPGPEGAFLPCSFWLVQALAASGEVDEASACFEELVALAGPLGLFPEEVDPSTGAFLGNYPQALTHASLVQAALAIRDAQDGSRRIPKATP